jgi:hypothetical protein
MASIWRLAYEQATGPQQPPHLEKKRFRLSYVLKDIRRHDDVERGIGKGQPGLRITQHDGFVQIGILRDAGIWIHAGDMGGNPSKVHLWNDTAAGTEVEHAVLAGDATQQVLAISGAIPRAALARIPSGIEAFNK